MLYREIIAVCSQIRTKHINTLCGQNVELLNVKLAVHEVTTGSVIMKCNERHHSVDVQCDISVSNGLLRLICSCNYQ